MHNFKGIFKKKILSPKINWVKWFGSVHTEWWQSGISSTWRTSNLFLAENRDWHRKSKLITDSASLWRKTRWISLVLHAVAQYSSLSFHLKVSCSAIKFISERIIHVDCRWDSIEKSPSLAALSRYTLINCISNSLCLRFHQFRVQTSNRHQRRSRRQNCKGPTVGLFRHVKFHLSEGLTLWIDVQFKAIVFLSFHSPSGYRLTLAYGSNKALQNCEKYISRKSSPTVKITA